MNGNERPSPLPDMVLPVPGMPREFWEMEHQRVLLYSDWLCRTHGFSRSGFVQGENISVKELRKLYFANCTPGVQRGE